jgi:hypothetical protein
VLKEFGESMKLKQIEWSLISPNIGPVFWKGKIAGKSFFTIEFSMIRGEGWVLKTVLPFIASGKFKNRNPAELKYIADKMLTVFINLIVDHGKEEEESK